MSNYWWSKKTDQFEIFVFCFIGWHMTHTNEKKNQPEIINGQKKIKSNIVIRVEKQSNHTDPITFGQKKMIKVKHCRDRDRMFQNSNKLCNIKFQEKSEHTFWMSYKKIFTKYNDVVDVFRSLLNINSTNYEFSKKKHWKIFLPVKINFATMSRTNTHTILKWWWWFWISFKHFLYKTRPDFFLNQITSAVGCRCRGRRRL